MLHQWRRQLWGTGARAPPGLPTISFLVRSLWSKSESQLSKYCVVCEISWCRCQQLTALSISTALVIKLLDIEQLLHQTLKFAMSAPWHNFHLCPSSQQILATPLCYIHFSKTKPWRRWEYEAPPPALLNFIPLSSVSFSGISITPRPSNQNPIKGLGQHSILVNF